jgi:hypothetical protein
LRQICRRRADFSYHLQLVRKIATIAIAI